MNFVLCYFTAFLISSNLPTSCQHLKLLNDTKNGSDIVIALNRNSNNIQEDISSDFTRPLNLSSKYDYQMKWPNEDRRFGAVTAVSLDTENALVLFHRVDRIWTETSFNSANEFLERSLGPINDATIVAVHRASGDVIYECGKNLFFMPHGLTVDHENNIWVTDVALHQVMKLSPKCSSDKPTMVLGAAFTPGAGKKFCKPTAVAVLPDGDFFVADGYCNSRILKLSKYGDILLNWGVPTFQGDAHQISPPNFFAIPHSLTLTEKGDILCVADRENGRVQCFHTTDGSFYRQYHNDLIGDRLFAVAFAPVGGGRLFVINGPEYRSNHKVQGFVVDMKTKQILSKWEPENVQFCNPHDVAVMQDGSEIYVAELDPPRVHKFIIQKKIDGHLKRFKNQTIIKNITQIKKILKPIALTVMVSIFIVTFAVGALSLIISKRKNSISKSEKSDVEYSKLMQKGTFEEP